MLILPQWSHRRAVAYSLETYPDTDRKGEADYVQCRHCQFTWQVRPGSGARRGWCYSCGGPVCGKPTCMQHCGGMRHFMREIERQEARGRWLRKIGIGS